MALVNQFYMDLDLKRRFERYVATFRSGDTVELIMSIFDNGKEYDISSANKATIYQKTCSGVSLKGEGTFDMINGKRVIRYTLDKLYTIETGFNTMILVLEDGDTEISIQPFSIYINDDLTSTSGSYIELIQDLMKLVEELTLELNNTIKLEEKGAPNGVATLDENGKIPLNQIPPMFDSFLEHIPQTVYKDQVHGMRINNDGILQHETEPNTWVDTGIGGGGNSGGNEDFLNVYIKVEKGIVNLEYVGVPSVTSQKWSTGEQTQSYFNNNGTLFTGNSFGVSQVGMHTLWYRDSNGNTYTKVFEVKNEDLDITDLTIEIEDGVVTVNPNKPVILKKWAFGQRDIAYFQNEGNVFTGNSFEINSTGLYTIYLKDENGIESVHHFNVDASQTKEFATVEVVNGVASVNYKVPVISQYSKWEYGVKNEVYFESNGNVIINDEFKVDVEGVYTLRAVLDPSGIVQVMTFNVTEDMLEHDTTGPELTIYYSGEYNTIKVGAVIATIRVTDNQSGVDKLVLPDGTEITENLNIVYDYQIKTNGTHKFTAYDKAGNKTEISKTISNIGIPTKISTMQLGSVFSFTNQKYVLLEKNGDRNLIAAYEGDSRFLERFDYDGLTNKYPNASIKHFLNNAGLYDTLGGESEVIQDSSWNYGAYDPNSGTIITNEIDTSTAGLLTIPQLKNAYNNGWITVSGSNNYYEWSSNYVENTTNEVYIIGDELKDNNPLIFSTHSNANSIYRIAYQVTNNAVGYI